MEFLKGLPELLSAKSFLGEGWGRIPPYPLPPTTGEEGWEPRITILEPEPGLRCGDVYLLAGSQGLLLHFFLSSAAHRLPRAPLTWLPGGWQAPAPSPWSCLSNPATAWLLSLEIILFASVVCVV